MMPPQPGMMPPQPGMMPPQPGMMPPPYPPPMGMDQPPMYPPPAAAGQPPMYGSMGQPPTGFSSAMNYATDYGPSALPPAGAAIQPTAPTVFAPYPDMPPPSYLESCGAGAALKDDDDNDHMRAEVYKPLYPTYTWNK